MREPNVSVFETTATKPVTCTHNGQIVGVEAKTKGEKDFFFGNLTIVCDRYNSQFRKEYIRHSVVSRSKFWGLELIDTPLPQPQHGHVVLGKGAPILLYQIGEHETRALVDIPENTPTASVAAGGVKSHLRNQVLPTLPKEVQPAFAKALDTGVPKSMPNSWLPPSTSTTPGLVLLGDAMNMRHPLTGGGMTVAFNDVVLLSELLDPSIVPQLEDSQMVLQQMRKFHCGGRTSPLSSTFSHKHYTVSSQPTIHNSDCYNAAAFDILNTAAIASMDRLGCLEESFDSLLCFFTTSSPWHCFLCGSMWLRRHY